MLLSPARGRVQRLPPPRQVSHHPSEVFCSTPSSRPATRKPAAPASSRAKSISTLRSISINSGGCLLASPSYPCGQSPSRSEEHTSELQSHSDLVCRLLLEKKKKHKV